MPLTYHGSLSGLIKNALDSLEPLRDDVRPYLDGRAVGCIVVADGWQACGSALASLRGIVHAEIHVRTLAKDLHSGLYGGAAPNAIETLWHLLEQLKGPDGRIRIPGMYDKVTRPAAKELKAWRSLPIREKGFREEAGASALTGELRYSFLERIWARPTLEVHGIVGGFVGAGAKTVIPAEATAKISLRLVPDQRAKDIAARLAKAVRKAAPRFAEVDVKILSASDPVQTPLNAWPFEVLDKAYREVWRRGVAPIRSGGFVSTGWRPPMM